ncbi:MAG: M28 family peptidase [Balneolaceae bacterium]
MIRSIQLLFLFAVLLLSQSVIAQVSDPYTEAYLKWDAGDYIGALEGFLEILDGPSADLYFDDIASLTGERYKVDELSEDGRNPVFSTDNQHFSWEESTNETTYIKVAKISGDGTEVIHTIEGQRLIFSPDGQHAILERTEVTESTAALQQKLSQALSERDRNTIIQTRNELQYEEALNTSMYRMDLQSGETTRIETGNLLVRTPTFDENGSLWFAGADPDNHRSDIYSMNLQDTSPQRITNEPGFYDAPQIVDSEMLISHSNSTSPFPTSVNQERHEFDVVESIVLHHTNNGKMGQWEGQNPVLSKNGSRLAFMKNSNGEQSIYSVDLSDNDFEAQQMVSSTDPIQHSAFSPDGNTLAYMLREGISWDIHMKHLDSGEQDRLSYDIQHELFPHFLNDEKVLGMMGESRHRRSHIYDVETKEFHRLFHNNSIRTVSMENEWEPSADGNHLLIVAQREGDTIAPEQGVYLVRIGDKITHDTLIDRLEKNLESEQQLLANAEEMFEPIYDSVSEVTKEINITRLYNYQKTLYDFGSKHITQPGNQKASEYIFETLKSFGYEPEFQWFSPSGDIETANVIARLEGTTHPEVVYILSSHFDSVQQSPGADDNSSGTAVLLEAARVLANNPQPATIIFASLTGEESGLLGAREFVRVAAEQELEAAGVVNNDMMGWTRSHRLDNTIRFSNYGIRDVQHSGAVLFTDLITYDSRYYRFTDAHVFFDAYGDVLGGIGSYPILGNPNYHQTTDRLETINHRLVQEVSRSTTATLMMLANAPSKVSGIKVNAHRNNRANVSWDAAKENDISHYRIKYTDTSGSERIEETSNTNQTLRRVDTSKPISIIAVTDRGIQGWDWTVLK